MQSGAFTAPLTEKVSVSDDRWLCRSRSVDRVEMVSSSSISAREERDDPAESEPSPCFRASIESWRLNNCRNSSLSCRIRELWNQTRRIRQRAQPDTTERTDRIGNSRADNGREMTTLRGSAGRRTGATVSRQGRSVRTRIPTSKRGSWQTDERRH